jgi:hypothetical protein
MINKNSVIFTTIILTIFTTIGCSLKNDCADCNCSSSTNGITGELDLWAKGIVAGQKIFVAADGSADTFNLKTVNDQLVTQNGNCSNTFYFKRIAYVSSADTNKYFYLKAIAPSDLYFNEIESKPGLKFRYNVIDNTFVANTDVEGALKFLVLPTTNQEDKQITLSCKGNNSSCFPYYMQKLTYSKINGLLSYTTKDGRIYNAK